MSKKLEWVWLVALGLTPLILWILPGDFFDHTGVELCPSKAFFNIECLGCGMTRAVMHLHHLQIEEAMYYNPGVVAVFPGLVILWGVWVWKSMRKLELLPKR
ncbi:MAG: DUF2752 domain-containing protein [Bacteroidetes bacterium]|nr:MAG: DUF2752 domain-containing protein [Bacteroidota bacterium]